MPSLTHLTLESNASAIGVTGAAGLVPLTSLRELVLPSQALGDQGLQVRVGAGGLSALWEGAPNKSTQVSQAVSMLADLLLLLVLLFCLLLQYIGTALVNLRNMSLYNDGHVSDDGLAALAGLRSLTALDLQGNVSITQVGRGGGMDACVEQTGCVEGGCRHVCGLRVGVDACVF